MGTAIRIESPSKRFGELQALAPLELEVGVGEVFGYLGPNGAGKTTTIRLLLGLLRPTSGKAKIFGLDAQRETVAAHRRIVYVGGETSLWPSLTGTPDRPAPALGTGGVADMVAELTTRLRKDTGAAVLYDQEPESLLRRLLDDYRDVHRRRPNCFCPQTDQLNAPPVASARQGHARMPQ